VLSLYDFGSQIGTSSKIVRVYIPLYSHRIILIFVDVFHFSIDGIQLRVFRLIGSIFGAMENAPTQGREAPTWNILECVARPRCASRLPHPWEDSPLEPHIRVEWCHRQAYLGLT
jgi:hypothetical protein